MGLYDVMGFYVFALMAFLLLGGIACIIVSRKNKEKAKMSSAFMVSGLIILFAFVCLLVYSGPLVYLILVLLFAYSAF